MANKLFKKTSSGTSPIKFYKKTSTGQIQCPVYRKTSNGMERLDQTLVTKTKIIKGYAQWNGSFRNSSGSGIAYSNYSDNNDKLRIYQGKYSSYHHLGVMCFKDLFAQARAIGGTITNATLKLTNLHSYYGAGLGTNICGAINMPNTKPSSFSFDNVKTTSYSGVVEFSKGGTKSINLNNTALTYIQNDKIDGFRLLSPTGFTLSDYGYFEGEGTNRPYIEITVEYDTYE